MRERKRSRLKNAETPVLRVTVRDDAIEPAEYLVEGAACMGRDESCEIRIDHQLVSRFHADFAFEAGLWWLRDRESTNGTYLDGKRAGTIQLTGNTSFTLGRNGPEVTATVENAILQNTGSDKDLVAQHADYYLGRAPAEGLGERTLFIRKAFQDVQRRHRRRNMLLVGIFAVILLSVGSYALYQRSEAGRQNELAENLFYSMKSLELEIARSEETLLALKGSQGMEEIRRNRARRQTLNAQYERFLQEMGSYSKRLSEEDRLILRVSRIFGECEIGMPDNFVAEVKRYIGYWQSTDRLKKAVAKAEQAGYPTQIAQAMLEQDLPPQFFYLALQESGFDPFAAGPPTYKGIAKGMWQFIPETARKYGLEVGPLYDLRRPDPADDRSDVEKSTNAAARYLRFIYTTDAQASALLVMASYNWGEGKVVPLIQKLPANPRDRNFWRLLSAYRDKIPQETYDYVFYIVAAAVIGENPPLFGFDFENPLRHLDRRPGA